MAAGNPVGLSSLAMITVLILSLYVISAESGNSSRNRRNDAAESTSNAPPRPRRNVIRRWCVVVPGTADAIMEQNLRTICRQLDCSIILPGGDCYFPQFLDTHTSVVLNLYYKANGAVPSACSFPGSMVTYENPTFGYCRFE